MFCSKEDAFVNLMRLSPFRLLKNLLGYFMFGKACSLDIYYLFGSSQNPKNNVGRISQG